MRNGSLIEIQKTATKILLLNLYPVSGIMRIDCPHKRIEDIFVVFIGTTSTKILHETNLH
jgi:hypothetical protein